MQREHSDERRRIHNRLLLALPPASLKRLEPHFEWVDLEPGNWVQRSGPARRALFINRAFVSTVKTMQDGRSVEVAANGPWDMLGLFGLYGVDPASWEYVVQIPGPALRIGLDVLRQEFDGDAQARGVFERYTHHVLGNFAQTAACHRLHGLKQRFCRWLLLAQDATGRDTLPMTHETMALMLGVQRSGVSIIVSAFQKSGVLRSGRGHLTIIHRPTLEAESCECYAAAAKAQQRMFESR